MKPFLKKKVFLHTGHIGDIIAFLPAFQKLNGTTLLIQDGSHMEPMKGFKFDTLKPLLESQGIETTMQANGICVDVDVSGWRECYSDHLSLLDAQARFVGAIPRNKHFTIDSPWIKVSPDRLTKGRVIFNKTPRYPNHKFPWKDVVKHFNSKALFIGTPQEHKEFCALFGNVEYYKTESCLDVAKAIQGADFFVGNQSSSFWIAAALRKPLLQETFEPAPNSIVEYEGAWYCKDGKVEFDKL
jgi:hypothetical protein